MRYEESETTELKKIVVEDIKKEIIAFANCDGGKLYVGVNDHGEIVGVDDADQVMLQIANMVRDAIKPDLTMFLHYQTIIESDKKIVEVIIQRGTERPYYIAKKGIRPEGVYVRQGVSTAPASVTMIREMIKETDGDHFEEMRSLEQNLTFASAEAEFSKRNVAFESQQRQSLKLMNREGIYTNLGLLLSDQCVHTIKVAVFQGTDQNVFIDRHEFTGSLFKQLDDVYAYIDWHNQTQATFNKLLRIDTRDYPEVAVREALLNLLVHRDYGFSASALISIYEDRMELVSVGGLLPGIELKDVMIGLSVCRNQNLANVFYRLRLIEAYGTGIRKIKNAYENTTVEPVFEVTHHAFKITLPNRNYRARTENSFQEASASYGTTDSFEQIRQLAARNGSITRSEVETLLKVSTPTAARMLRHMVEQNILTRIGEARNTRYTLR